MPPPTLLKGECDRGKLEWRERALMIVVKILSERSTKMCEYVSTLDLGKGAYK